MALIKCGECGREISDKAAACPGCGAPVELPSGTVNTQKSLSTADRSASLNYASKLARQIDGGDGPSFVHWMDENKVHVALEMALPPEKAKTSLTLEHWRKHLGIALAEELAELGWKAGQGNRFWRQGTRESERVKRTSVATPHLPACPTCGSTNIEKIALSSKVGAAVLVGIFALGKISKTFKCNSCGYQW